MQQPQLKQRTLLERFETVFDHRWLFRCNVKILVVTDSTSGGFGNSSGFHLGHVLDILATDPWPHVELDITKAHRQSGGSGVQNNFRFDAHDLSIYDQIWLFGIVTTGPDPLSDTELRALSEFMDQGGGVFATGDHENLGQAMCAEVPRVRSMRRWYHPSPGPNGEPVAPDQTGPGRHDTVVDTNTVVAGLQGSQSDEVPQTIRPHFYQSLHPGGLFGRVAKYPHPVLCGPDGVIEYLPDHMHEGLCEVPSDLSQSYTFDGYTTTEYPSLAGHQEQPQVIAWAKNTVTNNAFGVLAAYDGHRVDVGRVVVDATWHHWFNINLNGFIDATDPASSNFDASVVPKWDAIKAYFRNVAVWLARKNTQRCLRNGGWLLTLKYYDILITTKRLTTVEDTLGYYWQLGTFARDALGRVASQCQRTEWIIDIFEWIEIPELLPNPWFKKKRPEPDPPPFLDTREIERVVLGGVVQELFEQFGDEKSFEELVLRGSKKVEAAVSRGAAKAARAYFERYCDGARRMESYQKSSAAHAD